MVERPRQPGLPGHPVLYGRLGSLDPMTSGIELNGAAPVSPPTEAPPPKKPPTPKGGVAARCATLETEVTELRKMVVDMSRVLEQFVVQQTVAAAMPAVEQQLRSSLEQRIRSEGFGGMLNGTPPG